MSETLETEMWSAAISNSEATSCSKLEPAPGERVKRNEEGTERQSARSLVRTSWSYLLLLGFFAGAADP